MPNTGSQARPAAVPRPILCPVCGKAPIEQMLDKVAITARVGDDREVGGVLAFRCKIRGHIFFVRVSDVG